MKIVLIGYMGSGKSSVGVKLAEVLKIPFKDMDSEIENNQGMSISELFSKKGEIYFRKKEHETLKQLLAQSESFVLATGGGTPCYGDNMTAMLGREDVKTVYLKLPIEVLAPRLFQEKDQRPLLAHLETEEDLNDFIRKHLFERVYYYNQSEYIMNCGNDDLDTIVEKIVLKLF
ncbi:shikimate kinase [Aequorivita marina]|uniref:shikimate kinase n=1 Tax=Aequorivita marina TaxID=3073654 RepID=UPI002875DB4F|nr:shikimate kinase [Aequorivita sp. S2608]MDS1298338.1 shikimate kinase [Aequorivita sp. S2608]